MTTSQTEAVSRFAELTKQALISFCDGVSSTFGVDMDLVQHEVASETVSGLKARFNKLTAVNIIDSEAFGGTFQIIFDQEGLFTLGGIIAMLPEERIMSNRQHASPGLAESMLDAMGEAGNLLAGSLDGAFSQDDTQTAGTGDSHFSHRLPALVGKPLDKSEEMIGLAGDEEVFFIPCEMTVGSYPAFNCGVIFPKQIFGESSDLTPEQTTPADQGIPEESDQDNQNMQTAAEITDSEEPDKESDIVEGNDVEESQQAEPVEETPAEITDTGEIQEQDQDEQVPKDTTDSQDAATGQSNPEESQQTEPVEETPAEMTDTSETQEQDQVEQVPEDTTDSQETAAEQSNPEEAEQEQPDVSPDQENTAPEPIPASDVAEDTAAAPETNEETASGKIFESIRKITQSPAILPGQSAMAKNEIPSVTGDLFEILANDIMQNKVTWASPDDSLQQALAKMQQTDAGYIMIGQNRVLEGIVSKSDITRAMSPYLQPIFAKWRRPLDDATLKIRVKWIMSRPVRTIKPDTSLAAIMEYMSQFRGRCLPVTDEQDNVQGLVTAFDIFKALLNSGSNTPLEDQGAKALVESAGESLTA